MDGENIKTWRKIKSLRKFLNSITPEEFATKPIEEKKQINAMRKVERQLTYRYDFLAFCLELLGAESWGSHPSKWGKVHKDLCRFLRSTKNLGKNAFVQLPRYHLKTQIATIFYRLWRLLNDPELTALIVSGTLELSKGTARTIRTELETNEKLRDYYPHVLPDYVFNDKKNKWSETQFNVARSTNYPQCTIEAVGVEATVTGKHFPEVSMDDMVTPENSTTPEQCAKVIQYYKYLLSIIDPKRGRFLVVGTPYADSDLYTFLREPDVISSFRCFIVPVYDSNGNPIWPEMYDRAKIKEIASQQGPYVFSAQYLLDPVPEEQQEFKRDWLQFYTTLPQDLNGNDIYFDKRIIVDPITAKSTSSASKDRGVILVYGVSKTGDWYIIDYELYARAKESELFRGIFRLADKHGTDKVGWECVAYQLQGKYNLEEEAQRTGRKLRVTALKPMSTKKEARIRAVIPNFERGQVFIKRTMSDLIQELLRFPHGQTRDIIDAIAYIPQMLSRSRPKNFSRTNMASQAKGAFYY